MRKLFILDTCVLAFDSNALSSFPGHDVLLPIAVLEELDKLKKHFDSTGASARYVIRKLDELFKNGDPQKGVKLEKSIVRVDAHSYKVLDGDAAYGDNKILACASAWKKKTKKEVVLVTRDINLRIRAQAMGIAAEDYQNDAAPGKEDLYTGLMTLETTPACVDEYFHEGVLHLTPEEIAKDNLKPNQFVLLRAGNDKSAICRFIDGALKPLQHVRGAFGLEARNKEQRFALELLFDDRVKLVTLLGAAGTGKTLLAVAAGMQQVISDKKYKKLIISRSLSTVGKEIGALPGSKEEKMAPFIAGIMDNLNVLVSDHGKYQGNNRKHQNKRNEEQPLFADPYLALLMDQGMIEVEALAFMRGRSLPDTFMLIDEVQNLSLHELKTILTRAGDNTKIVLTGDIEQIDDARLTAINNGLTYAVEKFKDHSIAGHVTLTRGERSELATLAAKIL